MPTAPRATLSPTDLLEQLSRALDASEPTHAVRSVLESSALPQATRDRVLEQALLVGRRARQGEFSAASTQVKLSLGVVLVLCGALGLDQVAP